jgi:hypothetical protein
VVVEISANSGIQGALQSGLQGFQNASDEINQAASSIAERSVGADPAATAESNTSVAPSESSPVTADVVQLSVGENQAQANARSIQTANETIGSLIDEFV